MKNQKNIINIISKERILLFTILLATLISYFQITSYEFIKWDDDAQITENIHVKNFDLQSINYNLHQERYTFLSLTAFSAVYSIWGNNPTPFHSISLIFHLINIILVFLLTFIPLLPIFTAIGPLYLPFIGDYGRTFAVNYSLGSGFFGGLLVFLSPTLSKKITSMRKGKKISFQGSIVTVSLLIIFGGIIQLIV